MFNKELRSSRWPYCITIQKTNEIYQIYNIENWVIKNVGGYPERWNELIKGDTVDFYFKYESDAVLFALRWP